MSIVKIGNLSADRGEKVQGLVEVLDTGISVPVTIVNGSKKGKNILVTSGIHGGEYPGIVATMRMAKEINSKVVRGSVIFIHPVNMPSFEARSSEVIPHDGKNLNAIFPGDREGTLGEKLAYFIENIRRGKDFHMDLHSGDIHEHAMPFVYFPGACDSETTEVAKGAAKVLNMKYMVRSTSTKGAYSSGAMQGVPGLLLERGGCGLWSEEEVRGYQNDIRSILNHFKVLEAREDEKKVPEEITEATYLTSSNKGCWFPNVEAGEEFVKDELLGYITDHFGNVLEEYFAKYNGVVLYMTRSLAIPENCPLIAYGKL